MIRYVMSQSFFYNNKLKNNNTEASKTFHHQIEIREKNVDINKLLNRVKLNHQKEIKSKIIFFSLGVLLLGFVGIFLSIID